MQPSDTTWPLRTLWWHELDPATHPFTPGDALTVVRSLVAAPEETGQRPTSAGPSGWTASALARHYGTWARWYAYLADDIDCGTPEPTLPPCDASTPPAERTATGITHALLRWRQWLEQLASWFAELAPPRTADDARLERAREQAIAPLVTLVAERTGAGETWMGYCVDAIAWYLESTGVTPGDAVNDLVDEVVYAHFSSWVAPEADAVLKATADLSTGIRNLPDA